MNLNIMYDPKTNTGTTRKVISGGTNYYVGLTKVCANCGKAIIGYSAISRQDNKTEICSNCGSLEAIEEFMKYQKETLQKLLDKYYQEEDTNKRNALKQTIYQKYGTNKRCFRCGSKLLVSDLKEYEYLCLNCDENFYEFEVTQQGGMKMLFKEGQIKPFVLGKYVQYGKILEVHEEDETYLIEDTRTKKKYIIDEDDVFLGDD